ncbi:MAG: hypothetical protein HA495_06835 [Thaumarchaeota archaeon]|nr:hypothetical protein [Nitrososphaerota archaeon]
METNELNGFGYCDFHEEPVDEEKHKYKGCGAVIPFMKVKVFLTCLLWK